MEIMEEQLRSFRDEIVVAQIGTRTPSFREFNACRAPECFGAKDPIASHRWIANMENAQRLSFCPEPTKVGFASCLLRDRAWDYWEEATRAVGMVAVTEMT